MKQLWQLGLDWLYEANHDGVHPLDRERAILLARGMRMVGENPPYSEVSEYIGELWRPWAYARRMVRECWRSVYRARTSVGRGIRPWDGPLYQPDRLIEEHDLRPVTEERLAAVARDAVERLVQLAPEENTDASLACRREVDSALEAIRHLRFLRQGEVGLGLVDSRPDPPRRPKWW